MRSQSSRTQIVLKILGILLIGFSSTMLPPVIISWATSDGATDAFLFAFVLILALGLVSWLPVRKSKGELKFRDGFLIVVLLWTVLGMMGAVPLVLIETPSISLVDAIFEAMSGLTTTGATMLENIDDLPISILYYRQQLQWLGGMGIVVLAIAVLPMLGVGGMQLYRAETPGPVKDSKLTPRIAETAKALWFIYLGLTIVCAVSYSLAGMSVFDAVGHAFSTVAIGGFSTHDASLAYFDSQLINMIAIIFMMLSAFNFALHFGAFHSKRIEGYLRDTEARTFVGLVVCLSMITCSVLLLNNVFEEPGDSLMHGLFQVVSIGTTTGFTTSDFSLWPSFIPVMLILFSTIGGCAGSTAGGMKVIRFVLFFKQGAREISKLVHPSALIPIKLGGKAVPDGVIHAVWGFFSLYITSYVILSLCMLATGLDPITAFSAVSACLNNLGPGLGDVAQNYATVSNAGKMILSFAMLLGRLELFTLLVLFSPVFWKS